MGKNGNTKLRKADIRKVDLVDDGANPGARIALTKRNEEENVEKENLFKRFMGFLADAFGKTDEDVQKAMDEVRAPTYQTFGAKINENRKRRVLSEVWDYTYAIQNSIESILMDDTLTADQKQELALGSIDQFGETITAAIPTWLSGEPVMKMDDDEEIEKAGRTISAATRGRLEEAVSAIKALYEETDPEDDVEVPEGEPVDDGGDMGEGPETETEVDKMLDRTKLDPEVRAHIEELEKRLAVAEKPGEDDIFKGLTPAARQIVEDLRKRNEEAESREAIAKAREYEATGAKAEELAPILTSIRKKNPEAADKIEEVLKAASARIATGELFKEKGGSGQNTPAADKIEARAKEIMKAKSISHAKAYVEACDEMPDELAKARGEA